MERSDRFPKCPLRERFRNLVIPGFERVSSILRFVLHFPVMVSIGIVRVYRFFLSPDHSVWARALNRPPYCKHFPSCSSYAVEALERHGFFRGWLYSIRRILSCNPWSEWGFDPVPPRAGTIPENHREAPEND